MSITAELAPERRASFDATEQTPRTTPEDERFAIIEKAIAELRPYLKQDGGDLELVAVEGPRVYVKMTGACMGCAMASVTLAGVQTRLSAKLGEKLRVIPHTFRTAV